MPDGQQTVPRALTIVLVVLIIVTTSGCTMHFVPDFDSVTFDEILRVGKEVDIFYGTLMEQPSEERTYGKYALPYVSIEADIRTLVIRNKLRALNQESTEIAETILSLWVKYKGRHKEKDAYSDGNARLDRERLSRLFTAAASAESAKRLDVDDKDVTK